MKKGLLLVFGFSGIFILQSSINKQISSGAPSASTGATGEQACNMSGCHDDKSLNSGTATFTMEVAGEAKMGDLVPVKIKISDPGYVRFGFQVTALDESGKNAGEFIITDSLRTQTLGDNLKFPDRQYLTYTYYGTMDKTGSIEWEALFKPSAKGKITFYAAGISANNDGQDMGDYTYTLSKAMTVGAASSISRTEAQNSLQFVENGMGFVLLNPDFLEIKSVKFTDLSGKLIGSTYFDKTLGTYIIEKPATKTGLIVAAIETHEKLINQKIYIHHD